MHLQNKLDEMRQRSETRIPPEKRTIMQEATDALMRSGISGRALKEGEAAPAFTLTDQKGSTVNSNKLLDKGPLVVQFFRGVW